MSLFLKNPAMVNVVPNGVASVQLPKGAVYNRLLIHMQGTAADVETMISRVLVKLNQKIIFDLGGAEVAKLNRFRGLIDDPGFMTIDFIDPTAINVGSMIMGGIDTSAGVSSFELQITTNGAPADVSIDTYRDTSPPAPNSKGLGLISAVTKATISPTAAGKFAYQPPHGGQYPARIRRAHFAGPTVDAVGIRKNSLHVFEDIPVAVNNHDLQEYGRTPQTDLFTVDFCKRGDLAENLYLGDAQSVEYEITANAGGNVDIITEMIIPFEAI